ncbi:flavin reductase family protein [Hansschlegelia plantiphila]|uniref:Flavin reductase like domain-containing protein n=1 Tax=Hansschlegelia plantiphila TaxID=374655 RepID=A0A9W6J4N7_9HYPH|nr:flavin reductase family protein [Hansschlegelia plantiphila]GLK69741.1 hypothetical protein GCM10008179_33790 [Hansschlegelia plantiphila]
MSTVLASALRDDEPIVLRPQLDEARFKAALAEFPAAVTVVTCWGDAGKPVGATLSSCGSLSLDPPLMFAAFDRSSATLKEISSPGKRFLIHLLGEGQEKTAYRLAGKGADKFDDVVWRQTRFGPQLADCCRVFRCEVHALLSAGDHVIVTGLVHGVEEERRQPLVYHRREIYPAPERTEAPR